MDCFSSVVWSPGYTGLAEGALFSVVSVTYRWKARHRLALTAGRVLLGDPTRQTQQLVLTACS